MWVEYCHVKEWRLFLAAFLSSDVDLCIWKLAVTQNDLCKLTGEWFFAPIHLAGKLQFAIYFIKVSTSYLKKTLSFALQKIARAPFQDHINNGNVCTVYITLTFFQITKFINVFECPKVQSLAPAKFSAPVVHYSEGGL